MSDKKTIEEQISKIVYDHLSEVAQIGDNSITDYHIAELVKMFATQRQAILQEIADKNYDGMHGTYDYDGIAEMLLNKLEENN